MSDIVIRENSQIDLTSPQVRILSPRDPQYAIQFFADSLRGKLAQADSFTTSVYNAVIKEASTASQISPNSKKTVMVKLLYNIDAS